EKIGNDKHFDSLFLKDKIEVLPVVEKMSKSKLNVVTPDTIVEEHGADALRLYEMFLGPLELSKPWNTNGITGVSNFIRKLWRLYHNGDALNISNDPATKDELKVLHKTIKKITSDIENFSFNTSVSNFMICVNELTDLKCNKREILEPLAIIIAPYAPHIAEELWSKLGHTESITYATFPECNESYLVESTFNYPVSFNGKTRFFQEYDLALTKEQIEKEVLTLEQTQKYLEGKTPKKVIVVHNKIVNIVV
ncbi:MAG: class I tRNA ligase family protein, partial [Bacteroidia bacterium]|nr:class I tRNA ligase family protein [Bacteroidia bacterium]